MATSQDWVTWTCGDRILPKFLLWAIRGEMSRVLSRMKGSTHQTIYMDELRELSIPLPPLCEQQRIAEFLDKETVRVDSLIEEYQRQIELVDEERSAFARLALTGGNDTPRCQMGAGWTGTSPMSWSPNKVAWRFRTGSGTTPKSGDERYYGGNHPWVTTGELRESLVTRTAKQLTDEALTDHSALHIYPPGAVMIAMYGATIGRVGMLGVRATTNQAVCVLHEPSGIDPDFTYHWLRSFKPEIARLGEGGGQPNINQETVRAIRIPAPDLDGQRRIVRDVVAADERSQVLVDELSAQIAHLEEYRKALITVATSEGVEACEAVA